jgi:deazaflavin-dependent oxidoreductase (nitroreductase family)
MTLRHAWTDLLMKSLSRAHRGVLAVSRGRIGWTLGSLTAVELHTIGRSTGKPRSTMLTSPVHDDTRYVLIASKGGDDRNPQWYQNLVANPDVELTIQGTTVPMRARTASAEEKAQLWPDIIAAYRGYEQYQRKTRRDIPVVICEPKQE